MTSHIGFSDKAAWQKKTDDFLVGEAIFKLTYGPEWEEEKGPFEGPEDGPHSARPYRVKSLECLANGLYFHTCIGLSLSPVARVFVLTHVRTRFTQLLLISTVASSHFSYK